MKEIILDGKDIYSTCDIHELFAEELEFPEYYGKNLDALFDCLTELADTVSIHVRNEEVLYERLGIGYEKLCRVIEAAADETGVIEFNTGN